MFYATHFKLNQSICPKCMYIALIRTVLCKQNLQHVRGLMIAPESFILIQKELQDKREFPSVVTSKCGIYRIQTYLSKHKL